MGSERSDSPSYPKITSMNSSSESGISEQEWSTVLQDEALNDPKPSIERHTVVMVGVALFVLAMIWPPLILLVTYVASVLIPYSCRVNDDATARRQLLAKFEKEDTISASMREIPDDVNLKSSYWINSRYVQWQYLLMASRLGP